MVLEILMLTLKKNIYQKKIDLIYIIISKRELNMNSIILIYQIIY